MNEVVNKGGAAHELITFRGERYRIVETLPRVVNVNSMA